MTLLASDLLILPVTAQSDPDPQSESTETGENEAATGVPIDADAADGLPAQTAADTDAFLAALAADPDLLLELQQGPAPEVHALARERAEKLRALEDLFPAYLLATGRLASIEAAADPATADQTVAPETRVNLDGTPIIEPAPAATPTARAAEVRNLRLGIHDLETRMKQLRIEVAEIEAEAGASTAPWANHGLGFAVFPVNQVREFVDSWGNRRSGGRRHKGTDVLAPHGTELLAIEDGVIQRMSNSRLGGLSVYFIGDSGTRYYYTHLAELGPQAEGDRVFAGEVVGFNGDSGNARGTPHLHFQIAPDGDNGWINPYPLLADLWRHERGSEHPGHDA